MLLKPPRCFALTGSSLASNPLQLSATGDEVPAIINSDPPIMNLPQKPVLQPKESIPPAFLYTLRNAQGKVCVRASLGVEYVVRENKVSLLFSQHFYSAPQHILERGENSLGLPPTLSTAHCTVRKTCMGTTSTSASLRVHLSNILH